MINKAIVIGRLTADPELRSTQQGKPVANLRVATNEFIGKDEEGNRREHTEYHRLVLFGKLAEVAGNFLKKGRLIYAEGRIQTRSWDDAAGAKHLSTEIVVENMQMLGGKEQATQAA
ncbi:MAG TPA: single-stranded DNA-binding protein [Candidatus Dormibacteraeota bacterium]